MYANTLARPRAAGGTIAVGQVVTIDTGELIALVGSSDQKTTAAIKPAGIARTSAVDGAECNVVYHGECDALLGDTVAAGDELVVEYNTARLIPYDATDYDEGAEIYIAARALEDGVDGQQGRVFVNIRLHTVPTAPAT